MVFRIRRYARTNRRSRIARLIALQCEKFLHGYYNQGFYDLEENGEARVIAAVAAAPPNESLTVFDVGANKGDWAKAVLARRSDANIYCFEIVPAIANALRDTLADYPTARVYNFGLSSTAGDLEVFWNRTWETTNSISPMHGDRLFEQAEVETVRSKVDTGDAIVSRLGIAQIDLLKMDVEGHEIEVLSGFRNVLASSDSRPHVIQFEYGITWLPERHTLKEAYTLLEPFGYVIGRVYPDGIDFKPYAFADDHFRIGNYVAVQARSPLMEQLALFTPTQHGASKPVRKKLALPRWVDTVFVLRHSRDNARGQREARVVGAYRTLAQAEAAKIRIMKEVGVGDTHDDFEVDQCPLNCDLWNAR